MKTLQDAILRKHPETFWIKAQSEMRDGREWFRYDKVLHTRNPNTSLIAPLLESEKNTVDLAAHYRPDGSWKDHGILFKMYPEDLPLLLGTPIEYDLSQKKEPITSPLFISIFLSLTLLLLQITAELRFQPECTVESQLFSIVLQRSFFLKIQMSHQTVDIVPSLVRKRFSVPMG